MILKYVYDIHPTQRLGQKGVPERLPVISILVGMMMMWHGMCICSLGTARLFEREGGQGLSLSLRYN